MLTVFHWFHFKNIGARNLSVLIVFLLLLFSQSLFAFYWSPYPGRYDCPEITNSYECALSLEKKIDASFIHRINEKTLEIVLLNGEVRSFVDDIDNPETRQVDEEISYSALEVIGRSRYVVLGKQFFEGIAFSLLDRKTGAYHELKGYPLFSPDEKKLLVANTSLSGYNQTVLQVYKVMDKTIELEYKADVGDEWNPDWGAESIAWPSSSIITFTRVTVDCSIHNTVPCEKKILKYGKIGWEIFDKD